MQYQPHKTLRHDNEKPKTPFTESLLFQITMSLVVIYLIIGLLNIF